MGKRGPLAQVDCLRDVGVEGSNPFTPTFDTQLIAHR